MKDDNRFASGVFGTIMAVLGVILIACGFAWLIANNWQGIPAVLKILILAACTSGAYAAGIFLDHRRHGGRAGALYLLGSLLYTLSVYLIAQIFSTDISLRGSSNLLLIALVSVTLIAYILRSCMALLVALVELLHWVSIEYFALVNFPKGASEDISVFFLIYLSLSAVFYALKVIHERFKHPFAGLYTFWSAFYILSFSYLLTFEYALPYIMPEGLYVHPGAKVFFWLLAVLGLVSLVASVYLNERKGESYLFCTATALLVILIFSAPKFTGGVGRCSSLSCFELKDKHTCESALSYHQICSWESDSCIQQSCYRLKTKTLCENSHFGAKRCRWKRNMCIDEQCNQIKEQKRCEEHRPIRGRCAWLGASCRQARCPDLKTEADCLSLPECRWDNACLISQTFNPSAFDQACGSLKFDECRSDNRCRWNPGMHFLWNGRGSTGLPLSMNILWLLTNVVFIALILGVIGAGVTTHKGYLINLGILFFVLEIISRYIGFLIDYWGYTSLSLIFISGGVILLLGGWGIRRLWKKLHNRIRD